MDRYPVHCVIFVLSIIGGCTSYSSSSSHSDSSGLDEDDFYPLDSVMNEENKVIFGGGESVVYVSRAQESVLFFDSLPDDEEDLDDAPLIMEFEDIEDLDQDGPTVTFAYDSEDITIKFPNERTASDFLDELKQYVD